jgi:hypothetical protein
MHRNDFIVRRSCPQGRRAPQSRSVHARLGQRQLARAPGFARNVGSSPRQRLSVWTRPLFAFEAPPTSIQAKLQATALRDPSGRAPGRSGGQSKVRQFCRGGDAAEFGFLGPEAPRTWPVPVSRRPRQPKGDRTSMAEGARRQTRRSVVSLPGVRDIRDPLSSRNTPCGLVGVLKRHLVVSAWWKCRERKRGACPSTRASSQSHPLGCDDARA